MIVLASVSLSTQEFINSVSSQIAPTAPIATVFDPSPLTVVTPPVFGLAQGVLERTALNFYTSVQPATKLQLPVFPAKEHFNIADSIKPRVILERLSITTRKPGTPHHFYSGPVDEVKTIFSKKPEKPFAMYGLPSNQPIVPVHQAFQPIATPVRPLIPSAPPISSIPSIEPLAPPPLPELPAIVTLPQSSASLPINPAQSYLENEDDREVLPSPAIFAPQPSIQSTENKLPIIAGTVPSNKPPLIHGDFHPALPQVIFTPTVSPPQLVSQPIQDTIFNNNIQPAESPNNVQVSTIISGDNNDKFNSEYSAPDGTKVSESFKIISTDKWKDVVAKRGSYEYISPEGIPIKVKWIADHEGFRTEP